MQDLPPLRDAQRGEPGGLGLQRSRAAPTSRPDFVARPATGPAPPARRASRASPDAGPGSRPGTGWLRRHAGACGSSEGRRAGARRPGRAAAGAHEALEVGRGRRRGRRNRRPRSAARRECRPGAARACGSSASDCRLGVGAPGIAEAIGRQQCYRPLGREFGARRISRTEVIDTAIVGRKWTRAARGLGAGGGTGRTSGPVRPGGRVHVCWRYEIEYQVQHHPAAGGAAHGGGAADQAQGQEQGRGGAAGLAAASRRHRAGGPAGSLPSGLPSDPSVALAELAELDHLAAEGLSEP